MSLALAVVRTAARFAGQRVGRSHELRDGDTVEILSLPKLPGGRTQGEITYPSRVRLFKASWLRRNLVKSSSMLEINELVEHP